MRSRRCGLYLRVVREGTITAGDAIVRHAAAASEPTIAEMFARWGRRG
jgi:MOSC domain-containing protein YiiM